MHNLTVVLIFFLDLTYDWMVKITLYVAFDIIRMQQILGVPCIVDIF